MQYVNKNTTDSLNAPEIDVSKELFGLNNITVTLTINMSTQNASYVELYNISLSITPDPIRSDTFATSIDYNKVQLTLLYNTHYNVSAVATLCRVSSHPNIIDLFYGESLIACSFHTNQVTCCICVHTALCGMLATNTHPQPTVFHLMKCCGLWVGMWEGGRGLYAVSGRVFV